MQLELLFEFNWSYAKRCSSAVDNSTLFIFVDLSFGGPLHIYIIWLD